MIDTTKALITWLTQSSALVALVGPNICAVDLPEGFDAPAGDKAVVIGVRGGTAQVEVPIIEPSVQVKTWARKSIDAREIYRAVFDHIHGKTNIDLGADGYVLTCYEETQGQPISDPDTGWATVVAAFRLMMRAN